MTELAPEVSVMLIALGLVLSLVCYLVTNLSPGGMITPGWLALVLIVRPLLAVAIGAVTPADSKSPAASTPHGPIASRICRFSPGDG